MTERATTAWHNVKAGDTFTLLEAGHDQPPAPPGVPASAAADWVVVEPGPQEWYFPFSDPAAYLDHGSSNPTVENALFSPQGRWGILFSQHGHAVLGGEPPFVQTLLDRWPAGRDSVLAWLRDLRDEGGRATWRARTH